MFKIFDIPKNAGSLSRYLNICLNSKENIDVVILRNPYERFWSATKTIVNEISLFGGYPIDFEKAPIKTYNGLDFEILAKACTLVLYYNALVCCGTSP